jgi:glucosyl-3-phosphoglycerate synthase
VDVEEGVVAGLQVVHEGSELAPGDSRIAAAGSEELLRQHPQRVGPRPRDREAVRLYHRPILTIAVIGHNEAPTLGHALEQALQAERDGVEVVFLDSGSTDGSDRIAAGYGVRRIDAPVGKGRAMRQALAGCPTRHLAFVDADIHGSSANIPALLADAAGSGHHLVVGDFREAEPGVASNTLAVYEPLVARLFPEAAGRYGSKPLTGFRVLDTTVDWGPVPPGFGVEAHLNVTAALLPGARLAVADIGEYRGRFLFKPAMGLEIAAAVLDLAEATGRLRTADRPAWDAWVRVAVDHIATYRGEPERREAFRTRLLELATRPLPG